LPVMVPTHSTSIDLSVWHKDLTGREVVAHSYFDFNAVAAIPGRPPGGEKRCGATVPRRVARHVALPRPPSATASATASILPHRAMQTMSSCSSYPPLEFPLPRRIEKMISQDVALFDPGSVRGHACC